MLCCAFFLTINYIAVRFFAKWRDDNDKLWKFWSEKGYFFGNIFLLCNLIFFWWDLEAAKLFVLFLERDFFKMKILKFITNKAVKMQTSKIFVIKYFQGWIFASSNFLLVINLPETEIYITSNCRTFMVLVFTIKLEFLLKTLWFDYFDNSSEIWVWKDLEFYQKSFYWWVSSKLSNLSKTSDEPNACNKFFYSISFSSHSQKKIQ